MESELVTHGLLWTIESHQGRHGCAPTVEELAEAAGIPAEFSDQLVKRLRRELSAGYVSYAGGRYGLTSAGRMRLAPVPERGSAA